MVCPLAAKVLDPNIAPLGWSSVERIVACVLFLDVSVSLVANIWLIWFSILRGSCVNLLSLIQNGLCLVVWWQNLLRLLERIGRVSTNWYKVLWYLLWMVKHAKRLWLVLGSLLAGCPSHDLTSLSTLTSHKGLAWWYQLRQIPLLVLHVVLWVI